MEARAILRYARISPRKVSIVMDLIRNKPLDEALAILQYTPKAACEPLLKLVKSVSELHCFSKRCHMIGWVAFTNPTNV